VSVQFEASWPLNLTELRIMDPSEASLKTPSPFWPLPLSLVKGEVAHLVFALDTSASERAGLRSLVGFSFLRVNKKRPLAANFFLACNFHNTLWAY